MAKAPDSVLLRLPARVWLLLEEDEYETKFGDGRFLYATAAFWTESEATARMVTGTGFLLTVKPLDLVRDGDGVAGDLKLVPDEHITLEKVIELLSGGRAGPRAT